MLSILGHLENRALDFIMYDILSLWPAREAGREVPAILRWACDAEADRTSRAGSTRTARDAEADRWACDAEADHMP